MGGVQGKKASQKLLSHAHHIAFVFFINPYFISAQRLKHTLASTLQLTSKSTLVCSIILRNICPNNWQYHSLLCK